MAQWVKALATKSDCLEFDSELTWEKEKTDARTLLFDLSV